MRLATFGHALRPTSLSIAPVLCVPYRTSLFTFAFIQKVPAREFSPRRPPSALSVGWVFRNWHSFVCFHLSAQFFVYIPVCLTWPAVHCSLSQLRLFLLASLISCPLCLRPVSTLGSRSGVPLRDLKVASYSSHDSTSQNSSPTQAYASRGAGNQSQIGSRAGNQSKIGSHASATEYDHSNQNNNRLM